MKKLIPILSLFIVLNIVTPPLEAQPNKPAAGFIITLTAANAGNEWIYISRRLSGSMVNIDSAKAATSPVTLKGRQDLPEMLYLRITGSNTLIPVFTENSTITVFADFKDPALTKVNGSSVHKEYDVYNSSLLTISSQQELLSNEWKDAQKAKDEAKLSSLEKKFEELDKAEHNYNRSYILQNKGSFVSPFVIRRAMFYTLELDELKTLVNSLDNSVSGSVYFIDLIEKISILEKVAVGRKYTDISLPGTDGRIVNLSDFVGNNIILVDFWASWCGPCRRENPNVVRLYQDYNKKGFDIVGVSFDTNAKGWIGAISSDSLAWHHMSDLKGWNSKAAELYGVASIPHTVLLDKEGIIIAKNLSASDLRIKLSELLD